MKFNLLNLFKGFSILTITTIIFEYFNLHYFFMGVIVLIVAIFYPIFEAKNDGQ